MDVLETIKSLKVLKSLKPNELRNLSNTVIINDYVKGQYIYKNNFQIKYVYVVLEGGVKVGADGVTDHCMVKEILMDDEMFGENVFVNSKRHQDYAITTQDTKVLLIPVNEFRVLVMSNPAFYQSIMSTIVLKLHLLEERMKRFVFLKAKNRIMGFLKTQAKKRGHKIGLEEIFLRLNMSHKEIALITDTSRQTVARILGELKRDNIIHFTTRKPGKILIRNIQALA